MKRGKRIINRIAAITVAFVVTFTMMPAATGTLESSAASYLKTLNASASGQHGANLSWNALTKKQKKKVNGITVFRDGTAYTNLGKTATSFSDSGLKAGTTYTYQVKTYKKTVKKTKMWYNKATGKYQKKKPAKKYRGKKKTFKTTTYKYSNASPARSIKTAAATQPSATSGGSNDNGGSSGGSNNNNGGNNSGGNNSGGNTSPQDQVHNCVDYKGNSHKLTKKAGQSYWVNEKGALVLDDELWLYDKNIDGTSESGSLVQVSGATFSGIASPKYEFYYTFGAYNVDLSKLKVELTNASRRSVSTYIWDTGSEKQVSATYDYVIQNGNRIASIGDSNGDVATFSNNTLAIHISHGTEGNCWVGEGMGIHNGTISVKLSYDGKYIGTMTINTCSDIQENGMSLKRRQFYAVAETAIAAGGGSDGTIDGDYRKIYNWYKANVVHGQKIQTPYGEVSGGCQQAAAVLETWLIYNYGESAWGFVSGTAGQDESHVDYCLNSNPTERLYINFK